jgi:hypothetical protein
MWVIIYGATNRGRFIRGLRGGHDTLSAAVRALQALSFVDSGGVLTPAIFFLKKIFATYSLV